MTEIDLTTPLQKVIGNGAKLLADSLNLHTVGDLVYHFPRRYEERGEHTDIRSLEMDTEVTVFGQVKRVSSRTFMQQRGKTAGKRGSLLEVVVGDDSGGELSVTFFNQAWRESQLRPGRWGLFSGKVGRFQSKLQLNQPDYVLLDGAEERRASRSSPVRSSPSTRRPRRSRRGGSPPPCAPSWTSCHRRPIRCRHPFVPSRSCPRSTRPCARSTDPSPVSPCSSRSAG
ncbi:hypothetical protein GCM10027610_136510 [Dactylosporangium cerinum]